jgi:hypothetical protein
LIEKNGLFSNTANGAKDSAMHYSLIETAKENGLIPIDYLMHCLEQLSQNTTDSESLLLCNVKLSRAQLTSKCKLVLCLMLFQE